MPLSPDIIDVTITTATRTPKRESFGVPMLFGFHNHWPEVVRTYNDTQGLLDDGFSAYEPIYRMAHAMMSQNPSIKEFKVGRRTGSVSQTFRFIPGNSDEGYKYEFDLINASGVKTTITYTNGASETPTTIAVAIRALITAVSGITAAGTGANIDCTVDTADEWWDVIDNSSNTRPLFTSANLTYQDLTPNPSLNLTNDLNKLIKTDNDWYGLLVDIGGSNNVQEVAVWCETRGKLFGFVAMDTAIAIGTGGNQFLTATAANYKRTFGIFNRHNILSYANCAWMGKMFSYDPGTATWAHKQLTGIVPDKLSSSEEDNIFTAETSDGNWYQKLGGVDVTFDGRVFNSEYIDVVRGADVIIARLEEAWIGLMANNAKIPYTAAGLDLIRSELEAVLKRHTSAPRRPNVLASSQIFMDDIDDVASSDKATRVLRNVTIQGVLSGAFHSGKFNITLTP